ncbi:MAG TPA: TraR/DksA C4-type zinc finger protein [Puia sp.]|jgi:RNA polymerase-binding transcription factor DksA|nr:TraR/DksA C4-type zinc finger protein [Puia sp.]
MATKKKAAKPAGKKAVNVKKIAPAKKAAAKPAHSSGSSKPAKKAPAAKSIAKPAAKKVAPSPAKRTPAPPKKGTISSISKPAVAKTAIGPGKVQLTGKPAAPPSLAKTQPAAAKTPTAATPAQKQPAAAVTGKPAIVTPAPPQPTTPAVKPEPKKPTAPPKQVKVVIPEIKTKTVRKYEPEFTKSVLDTPQEEQTGPIMRYSDAELGEFRELINRKLDAAKKELAYLQGLITRKDEMGGDNDDARYMTMEDGSMSMEREQLSQMASRQITFIDHLEKALMRIENKTYGICRVTGKLIDKARLRAVPHATLSIEAKQMMNK